MIHRCQTCPFWVEEKLPELPKGRWGFCQAPDGQVLVHSDTDDSVSLVVKSSFGCVQHPMNKAIA